MQRNFLSKSGRRSFIGDRLKNRHIPFPRNVFLHCLIAVFLFFWIVLAISPTDRVQWMMENFPLVCTVLALSFLYRKLRLSNLSYLLIFLFLCLHAYAAHFTYQDTPVDMWLKSALHTKRSYFDRIVHFAFGLAWIYPVREIMPAELKPRRFWMAVIPLAIVLGCSALFEIVEMIAASVFNQAGQDYLGLQGDVFDTQKDMELGLLGGLLATVGLAFASRKRTAR